MNMPTLDKYDPTPAVDFGCLKRIDDRLKARKANNKNGSKGSSTKPIRFLNEIVQT